MKLLENIRYKNSTEPRHILDVYLPDTGEFPVFVYFHGGGFEHGDKAVMKFLPALREKNIAVVSANYRLYPDAKFPDFIEDAAAAVAWAFKNMKNYGKVSGVYVGGSSAGGYLSQMLCFNKKYLAEYGIDSDEINGYIHNAGQPTTHFNVLKERGIDSRRVIVDEAAPLYYVTENENCPPMQIIVSDNDIKCRLEQTKLLIETLKHFGYDEKKIDFRIMENSTHCSYDKEQTEEGKWIFAEIISEFILKVQNSLGK